MSNSASRRYRQYLRSLRRSFRPTVFDRVLLWACELLPFSKRPQLYHMVVINKDDSESTRPIYAALDRRDLLVPEEISRERIGEIAASTGADLWRVEMVVDALRFAKADAETW